MSDYEESDRDDDYGNYGEDYKARERSGIMIDVFDYNLSPIDRFKTRCLVYQDIFQNSQRSRDLQIKNLDVLISKIQRIEYKNPLALTLGYYCVDKKTKKIINDDIKHWLNLVEEFKKKNDDDKDKIPAINITCADIIRYARLIQSIL
jgi:hypothetical protein